MKEDIDSLVRRLALLLTVGLLASAATAGADGPAQAAADQSSSGYENQFFDSDGVRLRFIDVGSGEPVLLIHGFALNLEINWLQPGIVEALSEAGYRVIAYDFRGHGLSAKLHEPTVYGPPEIDDPIRLLDHLGIERAHVVGYSRGSLIALRLRTRHPERLRSLVLGGYAEGDRGPLIPPEVREQFAEAMAAGDYRPLVRSVAPALSAEQVEQWQQNLAAINDGEALAAVFRAGAEFTPLAAAELEDDQIHALAVVGGEDSFLQGIPQMGERLPGLEALVIPGADHATAISRPEFATAILGFLLKQRALQPRRSNAAE